MNKAAPPAAATISVKPPTAKSQVSAGSSLGCSVGVVDAWVGVCVSVVGALELVVMGLVSSVVDGTVGSSSGAVVWGGTVVAAGCVTGGAGWVAGGVVGWGCVVGWGSSGIA